MGLRDRWFHAIDAAWTPNLYEWGFQRVPPDVAIRAREEAAVFGFLSRLLEPGARVLEVGPGTGHYTTQLARRCAQVVAVDSSPQMRAFLEARIEQEGLTNVDLRAGRLPDDLSVGQQFDGMLTVGVLNYVVELEDALRSLAAAIKPGGWAIFTVPLTTREGGVYLFTEIIARRYVWLRSPEEAMETAEAVGLQVRRMATAGLSRGGLTLVVYAEKARQDQSGEGAG
jgi:cyclopropane fatty-acyl-phospholipid synthase-like methyltransferase